MNTAKELADMACKLDFDKNRYPEAEKLMASLIVESLHSQAERLDPSLYASDGGLSNEDKFNCAGFAGADTHSGGD